MLNEPLVILANGSFPTHPIPLQTLQEANTIICCDGAAEPLVSSGNNPDYIIGDLDSISEYLKEQFREIIIAPIDWLDSQTPLTICHSVIPDVVDCHDDWSTPLVQKESLKPQIREHPTKNTLESPHWDQLEHKSNSNQFPV